MGNFTTEFRWENQERDGKTLSRRMHYRFQEYEVGGEVLGLEKIKVPSGGSLGPERAVAPHMDGWNITTLYIKQFRETRNFCVLCLIQKPGFRLHYSLHDPRFKSQQTKRIFPFSKNMERLQGPSSLLFNGYQCSFRRIKRPGRNVDHLGQGKE